MVYESVLLGEDVVFHENSGHHCSLTSLVQLAFRIINEWYQEGQAWKFVPNLISYHFNSEIIVRPGQWSPPQKKKDRVAKLHYITRHVRNGCHHILTVMHSRHERSVCNEHFDMKRSQLQDSDAVYVMSKFNLSRNL